MKVVVVELNKHSGSERGYTYHSRLTFCFSVYMIKYMLGLNAVLQKNLY